MFGYFKQNTRPLNAAEKLLAQTNATMNARNPRVEKVVPATVLTIMGKLQEQSITELAPKNMKIDLEELFKSGDLLKAFTGGNPKVPGPTKNEIQAIAVQIGTIMTEPTNYGFKVHEIANRDTITINIDWSEPIVAESIVADNNIADNNIADNNIAENTDYPEDNIAPEKKE